MPRTLSRLWLWAFPATVGALAALLFAAGFWLAMRGSVGAGLGQPAPTPAPHAIRKPAGRRLVLVLGDSLSRGTGDESGKGYVSDVVEFLRRRGPAEMVNIAVAGAESEDLRRLVQSANVRALASSADAILLSVGGNDLSHALARSGTPSEALAQLESARSRFAGNLRATLRDLRTANTSAPICVLGLYQPFGGEGRELRIGASLVLSWNGVIGETALAVGNVFVIPVFDLFQGRPARLAADRFHPNREGYRLIAERVIQTLPPDS